MVHQSDCLLLNCDPVSLKAMRCCAGSLEGPKGGASARDHRTLTFSLARDNLHGAGALLKAKQSLQCVDVRASTPDSDPHAGLSIVIIVTWLMLPRRN